MYSLSSATPTHTGCTQLELARYRLHCLLKSGRGNKRQLHCLRFLRSSRQVNCARKNRQLSDLHVNIKSLVLVTESFASYFSHPFLPLAGFFTILHSREVLCVSLFKINHLVSFESSLRLDLSMLSLRTQVQNFRIFLVILIPDFLRMRPTLNQGPTSYLLLDLLLGLGQDQAYLFFQYPWSTHS